jgi:hypothetical protein
LVNTIDCHGFYMIFAIQIWWSFPRFSFCRQVLGWTLLKTLYMVMTRKVIHFGVKSQKNLTRTPYWIVEGILTNWRYTGYALANQ